jgi:hypothetical protein
MGLKVASSQSARICGLHARKILQYGSPEQMFQKVNHWETIYQVNSICKKNDGDPSRTSRSSKVKCLDWQTGLSASIELKGLSGALANQEALRAAIS